jgi:NAD(P)-dependent dehydrogenase (short-subunit alcohol dehydrogenase family)
MSTLLITGANRGLGLEFVSQYAATGAKVLAACRQTSDGLKALARTYPSVEILALDVADRSSIDVLAAELKGRTINVLINNAGIYGPREQAADKMDFDAWAEVFAVNTMAPLAMMQAFMPHLTVAKGSKIITVTSKMGSIAESSGGNYAYRSSKAALNMVMHSAALDLKSKGLSIAVLHPGWVRTDMGGANASLSPTESVSGMRRVIDGLTPAQSGQFFNYDGTPIAW